MGIKKWSEVESSPDFQALDRNGRETVRDEYFRQVVQPQLPTEQLGSVYSAFRARSDDAVARESFSSLGKNSAGLMQINTAGGGRGGLGGRTLADATSSAGQANAAFTEAQQKKVQPPKPSLLQRGLGAVKSAFGSQTAQITQPAEDTRPLTAGQVANDLQGGVEQVKALATGAGVFGAAVDWRGASNTLADLDAIDAGGKPSRTLSMVASPSGGAPRPGEPNAVVKSYMQAAPDARARIRESLTNSMQRDEGFISRSVDAIKSYNEEQRRLSGKMPDFTDIRTAKDFGAWAVRNGVATAPTMAASMLGAVAGVPGLLLTGGGMAVGDMTAARAESAQAATDPKRFGSADRQADAAATRDQNLARRMAKDVGTTAALAVPYAALDLLGPAGNLAKHGAAGFAAGGIKKLIKGSVGSVAEEALNEGGQEVVNIASDVLAGERGTEWTAEDTKRIVNSAAAGGLMGAGGHAGGAAAAAARNANAIPVAPAVVDAVAADHGITPKAAARIKDQIATLPPEQRAGFVRRAFDALERRGLAKKPGAGSAFEVAHPQSAPLDQSTDGPDVASLPAAPTAADLGWATDDAASASAAPAPAEPPADVAAQSELSSKPSATAAPVPMWQGQPIQPAGQPIAGPDGRQYQPIMLDGKPRFIPTDEIATSQEQPSADRAVRELPVAAERDAAPGDQPARGTEDAGAGGIQRGGGLGTDAAGAAPGLRSDPVVRDGSQSDAALTTETQADAPTPEDPGAQGGTPQSLQGSPLALSAQPVGTESGLTDQFTPQAQQGETPSEGAGVPQPTPAAPSTDSRPAVGLSFDMDGQRWSVTGHGKKSVSITSDAGRTRTVAPDSPTWKKMSQALPVQQPAQNPGQQTTQTRKPKPRSHPQAVRGSTALATISRSLGGLSPSLLADLSQKTRRTRVAPTGRKSIYTQWDNPAIPGVGPLFRNGGVSDMSEVARVLEESGYLPMGTVERNAIGAQQQAQTIIQAELQSGGSTLRVGDPAAVEEEARRRVDHGRDSMDDRRDPWEDALPVAADEFSLDDLTDVGFDVAPPEVQSVVMAIIADAEAAGIDTENIRDDVARQIGEEAPQHEYESAIQQAISEALAETRREAGQPDVSSAGSSAGDRSQAAEPQGSARGDRSDRPDRAVRPEQEGLTLETQAAEDLKTKTEREAAGTKAESAKRTAEQEQLRQDAEAKDVRDRADSTVDDFRLGQTAGEQLSGMGDMFAGEPVGTPSTAAPDPARPPRISAKQKALDERVAALTNFFTPGNVVPGAIPGQADVVLEAPTFDEHGGLLSVKVRAATKVGGRWVADQGQRARTHATLPSAAELKKGPIQMPTPADVEFRPAMVEDSSGKSVQGLRAEFKTGGETTGFMELIPSEGRLFPSMVDNGIYSRSGGPGSGGAVTKAYKAAIKHAEANGLLFTSDSSVTTDAARVYESLSRQGYHVKKSPSARMAQPPEVITPRWVTGDGSPVFEVHTSQSATTSTRYSLSGQSPGADLARVTAIADAVSSKWANSPPVVVVADMADPQVPDAVREADHLQRSQGAAGAVEGFWHDGQVYLVSSTLQSEADITRVLAHEVLGHHGLRGVFGDKLDGVLDRMARALPDRIAEKARQYGLDVADLAQRREAAEELLAELAQTRPSSTWVQKAVATAREFLRGLGMNLKLTDADIVAQYLVPARGWVERGGRGAAGKGEAMSRRADASVQIPPAIIGNPLAASNTHPRYSEAKAGDPAAALELARDLVNDRMVAEVRALIGDSKPIVTPVVSVEATGRNKIPRMTAEVLAHRLGLETADGIAQANSPKRTTMDGLDRLLSAPEFDGTVTRGADYLLVDDTLTQGGTFASLASHIRAGGGNVIGSVALTGKRYSATMNLSPNLLSKVRERFQDVEPAFRAATGYGFDALTESEARYLTSFKPADTVRARIAEAGRQAGERLGQEAALQEVGAPRFSRATPPARDPTTEAALRKAGLVKPGGIREKIGGYFMAAQQAVRERGEHGDALIQGSLDQFHGINRAVKREVGNLPAEQDPYVAARLANSGTSSVMRALMLHGQAKWADNGQHLEKVEGTRGLLDILGELGPDLNDWFGWMIGNRAASLMAEGRENNFTADEIAALQALGVGKEAKFRAVAREYAAFKGSVLDVAEKAGLIDAEARKVWDKADYIPFYRQMDESGAIGATGKKGLAGQSSGIRTLRGGTQALNDPMENILMNFSRLIDASLKNNALRKTVDVLGDAGSSTIEKIGYENTSVAVPAAQVKKMLKDAGVSPQIMSALPPSTFTGMAKMWTLSAPADSDVIRIMRNGKPEFYRVHDPLLLRAATSFVPFNFPGLGVMRAFKRVLTGAVTATPEFMMRNFIRDAVASKIISRDDFSLSRTIAGIGKSWREDGAAEAMLFAGASFQSGDVNAADPTGTAAAMRRALRQRGMNASSVDNFMGSVMDGTARAWEVYRKAGEAIENSSREAVYEATIRAGKSATEAAYEAKDLMDFSLRGSAPVYQIFADIIPFLNARVQGMYRLARSDPKLFTRLALQTKMVRYGMLMMAASLALAAANVGNDEYEKLPDFDKDTFWHIWIGGHHFRIPKPFELGVAFATIPERIMRYTMGADTGKKATKRVWENVRDQLAFDLIPQAIRPALDVGFNRDHFRGSPIESPADEGKRPTERYSASTSPTAKLVTSMTEPVSNAIGLSPKRLEFLVGGYLGTVGMYALGLSDMVVRSMSDDAPRPAMRADDIPVVKAFYRVDPGRGSVFESDLFEMRKEFGEIQKSLRAMEREGEIDKAAQLMAEHPEELAAAAVLERGSKLLMDFGRQRDAIYRDRNMTPEQKRAKLDEISIQRSDVAKMIMNLPEVQGLR